MIRRTISLMSIAVFVFIFSAAPASARRFALDDLRSLVDVAEPQISPDGSAIVVVVSRADYHRDVYASSLVLVNIATRSQRVLAPRARDVSFPRWSPSGDRLAFLASTGSPDQQTAQLFVLRMTDGQLRRLTHAPNDVQQLAWRPDGTAIAYVTADRAPHRDKFDDAFVVGSNDYMAQAAPNPGHIWLVNADGTGNGRLTSGPGGLPSMAPPYTLVSPISWSPNGKSIAFARLPRAYDDEANRQDLRIVDVATHAVRKAVRGTYQMMPFFSPSGGSLAYAYPREGDYNQVTQIFAAPAGGGRGTALTGDIDRNITWGTWMPGGRALLVGGDDLARTSMWIQPIAGTARRLDLGDVSWAISGVDSSNWIPVSVSARGAIAFTGSRTQRPAELYYMPSAVSVPQRLTDFNHRVAALQLGPSQEITWAGPDGFQEDGVLTFPPDFVRGKRYPLVLVIHGGPISASNRTFFELPQLFAARDFVVFEPNYRGSDNLGNQYERAIYRNAGDGPGHDVMAGVAAVEARGFVDASRIGVSGWSYGGFMTSWMIGHYHLWKAAVSGAAVNDWFVDYGIADDAMSDVLQLGTQPWNSQANWQQWVEQSPMTYARQITTPTLIMCDTGDVRVPIPESYEMFKALRDNHVPVQFVAYPVTGHLPSDPIRNADIDRRWVDWIARHLK